MHVIYDVSHNIAKVEEHIVDGKQKTLLVHRKVSLKFYCVFAKLKHVMLILANTIRGRSFDPIFHFVINTCNLRKPSLLR